MNRLSRIAVCLGVVLFVGAVRVLAQGSAPSVVGIGSQDPNGATLFRHDVLTIAATDADDDLSHVVLEVLDASNNTFFTLRLTNDIGAIQQELFVDSHLDVTCGVVSAAFAASGPTGVWEVVLNTSHPEWKKKMGGTNVNDFVFSNTVYDVAGNTVVSSLTYQAWNFARCDFDADGMADPAVCRASDGKLEVINSTTAVLWTNGYGNTAWIPAVADYDGDGAADIGLFLPAVGRWRVYNTNNIEIMPRLTFGSNGDIPLPGDYDGDGVDEFALFRASDGKIQVLDGYFLESAVGGSTWIPTVADYDGDRKADYSWFIPSTATWRVYASMNNYAESLPRSAIGGTADTPIVGQDFDGDGLPDMAVRRDVNGGIRVRMSSTSNQWTCVMGNSTWAATPADYDGNGKAELSWWIPSTGAWRVYTNAGPGLYVERLPRVSIGGPNDTAIPGHDFDGDELADMAVRQDADGKILIRESSTSNQWTTAIGELSGKTAVADYDGDGKADPAWFIPSTATWRILESSHGYLPRKPAPVFGSSNDTPAPADYDGDGKADIAVCSKADGKIRVCVGSTWISPVGNTSWYPAVADYDGDGLLDFAWHIPSTLAWRVYLSSSNNAERPRVSFGEEGGSPVPADYNGDGKADLAIFTTNGTLRIREVSANGSATNIYTTSLGSATWLPASGDYNGDGKDDAAWFKTGSRKWLIVYSDADNTIQTNNPTALSGSIGSSNDVPVIVRMWREEKAGIEIADIGNATDQSVGSAGRLPSIAVDSSGRAHIICDIEGSGAAVLYDKNAAGGWSTFTVYVSSFGCGSRQYYYPRVVIDSSDRAFYSGGLWGSTWPNDFGMGLMKRTDFTTAPTQWVKDSIQPNGLPVGQIDLDPKLGNVVAVGGASYWRRFSSNLSLLEPTSGYLDLGTGNGGEKIAMRVSKADYTHNYVSGGGNSVWHACTEWSYNNSLRKAKGWGYVVISDPDGTYPGLGSDWAYPGISGDNTEAGTAYIALEPRQSAPYGIYVNIWRDTNNDGVGEGAFSGLTFSPTALLSLDTDGTCGMGRFSPQIAPARSTGAWLMWSTGNVIYLQYIPPGAKKYADLGPKTAICNGWIGSLCVDKNGDIHLVYNNNGFRYRKVTTK